jgi:ubiquinone/menaquinone biosynthesis C-methylase UbiE
MSNFQKLWNKSAEIYNKYGLIFPQYKKTNKFITEIIPIKHGQFVVDLACGTGFTTKYILKKLGTTGKIYALDFSSEMIKQAKKNIDAKNIEFILAPAEKLSFSIHEKVDLILCNSSFWQFTDYDEVLKNAYKILKDGGLFVFNLNQQFYDFGIKEISHRKIILEAIFLELKNRGYSPENKLIEKLNQDQIKKMAIKNGLTVVDTKMLEFTGSTLEDNIKFFEIPAVAPFFEGIPEPISKNILDNVYNFLKINDSNSSKNKWIYFILKKN